MAKKEAERSEDYSGTPKKKFPQARKNADVERALIENFVALQKVMTNLSMSFDNLSGRISKLLDLFEASAKSLAERGDSSGGDQEIKNKVDTLLEQNKILAKGIAMLHEDSDKPSEPREDHSLPQQPPRRMDGGDNYQKSVYSKP